jgi:hypothetical protein
MQELFSNFKPDNSGEHEDLAAGVHLLHLLLVDLLLRLLGVVRPTRYREPSEEGEFSALAEYNG